MPTTRNRKTKQKPAVRRRIRTVEIESYDNVVRVYLRRPGLYGTRTIPGAIGVAMRKALDNVVSGTIRFLDKDDRYGPVFLAVGHRDGFTILRGDGLTNDAVSVYCCTQFKRALGLLPGEARFFVIEPAA